MPLASVHPHLKLEMGCSGLLSMQMDCYLGEKKEIILLKNSWESTKDLGVVSKLFVFYVPI